MLLFAATGQLTEGAQARMSIAGQIHAAPKTEVNWFVSVEFSE